jgi:hypothetical protein
MKSRMLRHVTALAITLGSMLTLQTSADAQGMQCWMWQAQLQGQLEVNGQVYPVTRSGMLYVTTPFASVAPTNGQNPAEVSLTTIDSVEGVPLDTIATNTGLFSSPEPLDVAYVDVQPQYFYTELDANFPSPGNAFRFSATTGCQIDWGRVYLESGDGFQTVVGWMELYGCGYASHYVATISGRVLGTMFLANPVQ